MATSFSCKRGYSISSKHKSAALNDNPGPGQYNPVYLSHPQDPKVSFKGKHESYKIENTPGPAQVIFSLFSILIVLIKIIKKKMGIVLGEVKGLRLITVEQVLAQGHTIQNLFLLKHPNILYVPAEWRNKKVFLQAQALTILIKI